MNKMYTTIDLTQKTGFLVLELPTATIQVYMYPNNQSLLISRRDENLVVDVSPVGVGYPREDPATVASELFSYIASESSGTIVKNSDAVAMASTDLPATVASESIVPTESFAAIASESIPNVLPVTSTAKRPSEVST